MRWALCSGTDVQGNNSQQVSTGVMEMKDGLNRTLKMESANISTRGKMWCKGDRACGCKFFLDSLTGTVLGQSIVDDKPSESGHLALVKKL
jgi:hypothetical protein